MHLEHAQEPSVPDMSKERAREGIKPSGTEKVVLPGPPLSLQHYSIGIWLHNDQSLEGAYAPKMKYGG